MGKLSLSNLKKTIYYLKRNGVGNTWSAIRERMKDRTSYVFTPISGEEAALQREKSAGMSKVFSILVPTYRTKEIYLREMIASVTEQTYPHWELILADATEDDSVELTVDRILRELGGDRRIRYEKLPENAGIAANTNQALALATGDYVGLLDHDDLLTSDALYEMAVAVEKAGDCGKVPRILYSDEDKCSGDASIFYDPNHKEDFNWDLLLSNNYICHFLVMERGLIQELGFRSVCDGAQDYDLVLRAASKVMEDAKQAGETPSGAAKDRILHIPRVLYHWRCHTGSTAENPASKQYAYEAGLRALQELSDAQGMKGKAVHLKHLGFYRLEYPSGIFESRSDIGAVGGRVLNSRGLIVGGRMSSKGEVFYRGLPDGFSGYLHRAVLTQNGEAVDLRCISLREECRNIFERIAGVPYTEVPVHTAGNASENRTDGTPQRIFDVRTLPQDKDPAALGIALGKALTEAGYRILYLPTLTVRESV